MKLMFLNFIGIGMLSLGLCNSGFGQTQRQKPSDNDKAGKTVTVTGCLQKGDEADEYSIRGTDGKEYGVRSTTVKLADHLNHKVTLTGKTTTEKGESAGAKKEQNEEHQHMNATSLKMVSTSCQ